METTSKKIIIVFNNLNIGGIETKIVDISKHYSKKKNYKLTIILKTKIGPLLAKIPPNINLVHPPLTDKLKLKTLIFPFWLSCAFNKIKPNLVIAFGNYSAISAIIGKMFSFSKTKLVISEDSSIIQQLKTDSFSFLRIILVKILYPFSNSIIVLSQSGKSNLLKIKSSLKNKIAILENWLPNTYPKQISNQKRDIDILFLGRFEPQKNPLKFLKICKRLLANNPKLNISMVGYGSLTPKIKKYIFKNNLNPQVSLHPKTTKSYKYFQRSKLFLLTSRHEGFPLTLLEATASGSIPICISLKEIQNYFDFSSNYLLYNTNTKAIKNIKKLLSNSHQRKLISSYYQKKTLLNQQINFNNTVNHLSKYL
ncbi:MAG TPA: glycosyltransferase [Candidatus Methanoperedens sp.]|nr:glycosyltransferase [Candidatus Methanoperedens sp.]